MIGRVVWPPGTSAGRPGPNRGRLGRVADGAITARNARDLDAKARNRRSSESGFALLLIFAMAAALALMLYVAMPRVAFEAQRDKEQLLIERGEQYQRAIQLYFRKFKQYPASIEQSARALHVTPPVDFAISDIMMQILTRDSQLELAVNHAVDELSPEMQPADRSEELFKRFKTYLNAVAMREGVTTKVAHRGR